MCTGADKARDRGGESVPCRSEREGLREYKIAGEAGVSVLPIFSEGMFMEKLNYCHQNPVRAGLVERATDYLWSSTRIWQGCPSENEPLQVDKDLICWRRSSRR